MRRHLVPSTSGCSAVSLLSLRAAPRASAASVCFFLRTPRNAATVHHNSCAVHSAPSALCEGVRWAHQRTPVPNTAAAPASASPTASSAAAATTLGVLARFVQQRDYTGCAAYYENHFDSTTQHFVDDFCRGFAADARDALVLLMRVYTNLGRIDKVRLVLSVAIRDLAATDVTGQSPSSYASLGSGAASNTFKTNSGTNTRDSSTSNNGALKLGDNLLSSSAATQQQQQQQQHRHHSGDQRGQHVQSNTSASSASSSSLTFTWHRPSLLNASIFNAYLEALTRRNKFALHEITFLLDQMHACGVERNALTYHYLVELHVRAGYDPSGLWAEMAQQEPPISPLPATVQTFLLRVVPYSSDPSLIVDVTRAALQFGTAVMDKRMLAELMEQWLAGTARSFTSTSSTTATATTTSHHQGNSTNASSSPSSFSSASPSSGNSSSSSISGNAAGTLMYPPEYILWLMLELELRCVLEKANFTQYVQRQHFTELLLRCAKSTDAGTAEHVLALMDRHAVPKTADVLALVVWCWSQAQEIEKTLDLIEWMSLKGYLDQVDCFRKAFIDSIRYPMEQHYLMTFADAISTTAMAERALAHLQQRQQRGEMVTAHTLDLVVLGLARAGEERRALRLVSLYESRYNVTPRTNTFNSLLVGCSRHRSTMLHRVIYRTMVNSGVVANVFTFRVLIRQAVTAGNIDEAIFYLEEVTRHPGLRVEVEMILPILERAGRAGDVATVNRMSQYSLKCDIGIDGTVLRSVMQQLVEAGQSVEVLKGQLPLHEALRSRSKTGRQRARNEVLL